jgi:hypothetical protein
VERFFFSSRGESLKISALLNIKNHFDLLEYLLSLFVFTATAFLTALTVLLSTAFLVFVRSSARRSAATTPSLIRSE